MGSCRAVLMRAMPAPPSDLRSLLIYVHSKSPVFKKPEPGMSAGMWTLRLVRSGELQTQTRLYITRDQLEDAGAFFSVYRLGANKARA